jgi:hypothetical protein
MMASMHTIDRLEDLTARHVLTQQANNLAHYIRYLVQEDGGHYSALARFTEHHPSVIRAIKADPGAGTTTGVGWAGPLAPTIPGAEAFVELSLPNSLIGKLTAKRRVAFNSSTAVALSGPTFKWTAQTGPKSVSNMQFAGATLPPLKSSGILVLSRELVLLTSNAAVNSIRRELTRGMSQFLDGALTDPVVAAVGGVSPASITNGAPSVGSAGATAASALTDVKALVNAFVAANPGAESAAMLMSPAVAVALAVASNSQTLGINGGSLYGIPVYTGFVGSRVIVLDPTALLLADEGGMELDLSQQASVEMDSAATSPPTASTVLVNFFASNLVGIRLSRFINWRMARANSAWFTNVSYT